MFYSGSNTAQAFSVRLGSTSRTILKKFQEQFAVNVHNASRQKIVPEKKALIQG
jgi:hypothetical protein